MAAQNFKPFKLPSPESLVKSVEDIEEKYSETDPQTGFPKNKVKKTYAEICSELGINMLKEEIIKPSEEMINSFLKSNKNVHIVDGAILEVNVHFDGDNNETVLLPEPETLFK